MIKLKEFRLFKKVQLYKPEFAGKRDLLIHGTKIVKIADDISFLPSDCCEVFDMSGLKCFPGFIDGHVHIIGGGGEGGFFTRTTPGSHEDFFNAGTTAVIGVLGTDGITRTHRDLLGQARKFDHFGLKTFLMTGNYALPLVTLTGSMKDDICFVPEYIGIGEIAVSDHRGSGITTTEFRRILLDSRVAGMLSGKKGKAIIHIGGSPEGLKLLREAVEPGDLSPLQIMPTHITRNEQTLSEGIEWVQKYGGYIDFTASEKTATAIAKLVGDGIQAEHLTCSSDGWGSFPVFDEKGVCIDVKTAPVDTLQSVFRELVVQKGIAVETALKIFTSNVSEFFGLSDEGYGHVRENGIANLIFYDDAFNLKMTVAKGEIRFSCL